MANFTNGKGARIETSGNVYKIYDEGGVLQHSADVGKWSDNAAVWILHDIQAGYYPGFRVEEERRGE